MSPHGFALGREPETSGPLSLASHQASMIPEALQRLQLLFLLYAQNMQHPQTQA